MHRMLGLTALCSNLVAPPGDQALSVARNPRMYPAHFGKRVDELFHAKASEDKVPRLFVRCRGRIVTMPDVVFKHGKFWADCTTEGQWAAHEEKYSEEFGEGIKLIYEQP